MFRRTIWYKLPECIFDSFEIARVKGVKKVKFLRITRVIYPFILKIA